jgi:sugar phosphate isomerase/epimerase
MAQLSMNETTTFRWSLEEDAGNYAAAEIPAIGVWRQKLSDCGLDRAADLIVGRGLDVSHVLWAGGFTGSDGRSYRESVDDAREAIHAAARLKAPCLVVYSGARAGHTSNHAHRLFRDALKQLAPVAEEHGVALAIEPMHPGCADNCTVLTSADDALSVIDAIDSPAIKMVFDTYHLGFEPDIVDRIATLAPRIALVQLGDAKQPPDGEQNRCRLGEGVLPLGEMVAALRRSGYDGYFDVELLGEEIEPYDYHALLAHARDAYAKLVGG